MFLPPVVKYGLLEDMEMSEGNIYTFFYIQKNLILPEITLSIIKHQNKYGITYKFILCEEI